MTPSIFHVFLFIERSLPSTCTLLVNILHLLEFDPSGYLFVCDGSIDGLHFGIHVGL